MFLMLAILVFERIHAFVQVSITQEGSLRRHMRMLLRILPVVGVTLFVRTRGQQPTGTTLGLLVTSASAES